MNTEANIKGQRIYRGEARAGGRKVTSYVFGYNFVLSISGERNRQLRVGLGCFCVHVVLVGQPIVKGKEKEWAKAL